MESGFWVAVGDFEIGMLAVGGALFVIVYTLLAKWWRFREGRFIFTASLWLTVLFAYIFAGRAGWLAPLDDGGARVWLRLAVFTPFAIGLVWLSVLLLMAQWEKFKSNEEVSDAPKRRF